MANGSTDIEVTPSELRFRFQIGKSVPSHVVLHNPTIERHAFKIKTTSPRKYCVRPASGVIESMETKQIEVIMQSQKEFPPDAQNVRDKFLLLTTPVEAHVQEAPQELFDKEQNKRLKESRLRVVLEIPTPPTTIHEHVDEGEEVTFTGEKDAEQYRKEIELLKQKMEKTERQTSQKLVNGFTLFHLVLVAILAFLIGHYLAPITPVASSLPMEQPDV